MTKQPSRSSNDRKRLAALGAFCARFEAEGFRFGEWRGGARVSPGVIEMPYCEWSKAVKSLVQHCYDNGWVLRDFDWGKWEQSNEAAKLRTDPATLAVASVDQLTKLLTMVIRRDRFCEGSLQDSYDTSLLLGILRRAQDLAADRAR